MQFKVKYVLVLGLFDKLNSRVTNPPYVNDYDVNTLSIHARQDCQQRLYSLYC